MQFKISPQTADNLKTNLKMGWSDPLHNNKQLIVRNDIHVI